MSKKAEKSKASGSSDVVPAPGDLVCVTGANGFIASWIVKMLIERGYKVRNNRRCLKLFVKYWSKFRFSFSSLQVRATVRSSKDAKKVGHLSALGANVELVDADLNDPKAFFDIFKGMLIRFGIIATGNSSRGISLIGCKWVMHTASPYTLTVKDAQKDLVVCRTEASTLICFLMLN